MTYCLRPGGDWFLKRGVGRQCDAEPCPKPRESCGPGAGWPRSRAELAFGSCFPLSGLKHGPGSWPANPASPRHSRHAQERKATQVPGPRRLLWARWARAGALKGLGLEAGRGLDSTEASARLPATGGRLDWGLGVSRKSWWGGS